MEPTNPSTPLPPPPTSISEPIQPESTLSYLKGITLWLLGVFIFTIVLASAQQIFIKDLLGMASSVQESSQDEEDRIARYIASWNTYQNPLHGFEFKHPPYVSVGEEGNVLPSSIPLNISFKSAIEKSSVAVYAIEKFELTLVNVIGKKSINSDDLVEANDGYPKMVSRTADGLPIFLVQKSDAGQRNDHYLIALRDKGVVLDFEYSAGAFAGMTQMDSDLSATYAEDLKAMAESLKLN